jgi:hypothetical protein
MASFASLVYGSSPSRRSARALMSGGRAESSRSHDAPTITSHPVTPSATSTSRALARGACGDAAHVGSWPTVYVSGITMHGAGGCLCSCHGSGDTSGLDCDVDRTS